MSSRRFISLYYASISTSRALQAIACWLRGPFVSRKSRRKALAQAVASDLGSHAVFATRSGRSALALCLRAAGIGAGDEVVVSSYTCLAVATAVVASGATPVYADINPQTLNVNAETVRAALTPRVRAVIIQHTLGKPAPVDEIAELVRGRNVLLIEDCALAVGSRSADKAVGTAGNAAIFSLELSKTISSGWGGILAINEPRLAAAAAVVYDTLPESGYWAATRDLWQTVISAWSHQPEVYDTLGKYVLFAGFRSRLFRRSTPPEELAGGVRADFIQKLGGAQADLARLQWRDLRYLGQRCESNALMLRAALRQLHIECPGCPADREAAVTPRVSFLAADRGHVMRYFRTRGVELGEWFDGPLSPVPTAPEFNYRPGSYPNAERVARHVVNLPSHNRLTAKDVGRIIAILKAYHESREQT